MTTIDKTNHLFAHHHPAQSVQINARGEQDRAGLKENDPCLNHVVVENSDGLIKHYDVYFFYESGTARFNGRTWD